MTLSVDDVTSRQLVYVKLLYREAADHARRSYNPIDRTMAVIGFDHVNETLLKLIHFQLTGTRNDQKLFHNLVGDVSSSLATKGFTWQIKSGEIKNVRSIRNDAQHNARYPNEDEVRQCHVYTKDFVDGAFSAVWGRSFEAVDMAMLIDDTNLRGLCQLANECSEVGHYDISVIVARMAFEWAVASVRRLHSVNRHLSWIQSDIRRAGSGQSELDSGCRDPRVASLTGAIADAMQSVGEALDAQNAQMFLWATGVPVENYHAYLDVCRFALWFSSNQTPHIDIVEDFRPDLDGATRVISFVVDTIIQWQAQGLAPGVPDEANDVAHSLIQTKAAAYRRASAKAP